MLNKNNSLPQDNTAKGVSPLWLGLQVFAEGEATTTGTETTTTTTDTTAGDDTTTNTAGTTTTTGAESTTTTETKTETATGAPETYKEFTLPEGFQMDQEALAEFMPLAKELGMTQEAAQKAIGLHTKAIGAIMGKMEAHRNEAYTAVMAEVKADPQLGGTHYEANVGKINGVLNKFGGEGSSDIFHSAVAQIAAHDPAKAKAMYSTLHSIAKAASNETFFVKGTPKTSQEFYPGVPQGTKLR